MKKAITKTFSILLGLLCLSTLKSWAMPFVYWEISLLWASALLLKIISGFYWPLEFSDLSLISTEIRWEQRLRLCNVRMDQDMNTMSILTIQQCHKIHEIEISSKFNSSFLQCAGETHAPCSTQVLFQSSNHEQYLTYSESHVTMIWTFVEYLLILIFSPRYICKSNKLLTLVT